MASFQISVAPVAMYQCQPFDINWVVIASDPTLQGTAQVSFIVNGQTVWNKAVNLPMTSSSLDRVNPPAAPLAAHRLYDIPPGTNPPNTVLSGMQAVVNAGGQTTTIVSRAQVHVYPLVPIVEWGGPMVPGQPLSLPWGFDTTSATEPSVVGSYATATIVFQIADAAGAFVPLQPESPPVYVQLGGMQCRVPLSLIPHDPQIARTLFKIGRHALRATLTITMLGFSASWTLDHTIEVVAEPPSADWWRWILPNGLSTTPGYLVGPGGWNTPYHIGGRFVNRSGYAVVEVDAELEQTELWGELPVPQGPLSLTSALTLPAPILPGADDALGDAVFPDQTQAYDWLDPVTSTFSPSAGSRVISYFVFMTTRDAYGNRYKRVRSAQMSVNVSVSDSKLLSAQGAMLTRVSAVLMLVAAVATAANPIASVILSSAAAIAFFISGQLQGNALDPPAPDARYLSII